MSSLSLWLLRSPFPKNDWAAYETALSQSQLQTHTKKCGLTSWQRLSSELGTLRFDGDKWCCCWHMKLQWPGQTDQTETQFMSCRVGWANKLHQRLCTEALKKMELLPWTHVSPVLSLTVLQTHSHLGTSWTKVRHYPGQGMTGDNPTDSKMWQEWVESLLVGPDTQLIPFLQQPWKSLGCHSSRQQFCAVFTKKSFTCLKHTLVLRALETGGKIQALWSWRPEHSAPF